MTTTSSAVRRAATTVALLAALARSPAAAQISASYKLQESVINAGGNPRDGGSLASAHFHVKLDAIGDGVVGTGLASASFHVDAGFAGSYPPPGEATGLRFSDKATLTWNPEKSVGAYALHRDLIASLPGTFGSCQAGNLPGETAADASSPSAGQGYFYLVTARNRLREEGPKGYGSDGTEEGNASPCP